MKIICNNYTRDCRTGNVAASFQLKFRTQRHVTYLMIEKIERRCQGLFIIIIASNDTRLEAHPIMRISSNRPHQIVFESLIYTFVWQACTYSGGDYSLSRWTAHLYTGYFKHWEQQNHLKHDTMSAHRAAFKCAVSN